MSHDDRYVIGLDVGGTKVAGGVVSFPDGTTNGKRSALARSAVARQSSTTFLNWLPHWPNRPIAKAGKSMALGWESANSSI
jgi:hypothetical protein